MLTQQIYQNLQILPDAERGQAYSAIFAYIYTGRLIDEAAPYAVRLAFYFAKSIIDPALARKKKIEERRHARKENKASQQAPTAQQSKPSRQAEEAAVPAKPQVENTQKSNPGKIPGKQYFSTYILQAYRTVRDPIFRDSLIRKELAKRHPGFTKFEYEQRGFYRLIG